ncbi:MAG: energy transducer TonB [Burkholderiales bacterium]|nr:energy transducer TonB [Burkholderiales bacterium]
MSAQTLPFPTRSRRNLAIAGGVVATHALALWALQAGLLRRPAEVVVPVEVLGEVLQPPTPRVEPLPPKPPQPVAKPVAPRQAVTPPPPTPVTAAPEQPPAPVAPAGTAQPQPAPAPIAAPLATALPAPPAPAPVEPPSTDAAYLRNPKPAYPPMSKRLGEQGKVIVRVLIGVDGTALDARVRDSSGYDRLDRAALETVRKWRFVPGRRAGVPEAMWFNVPFNFVLE